MYLFLSVAAATPLIFFIVQITLRSDQYCVGEGGNGKPEIQEFIDHLQKCFIYKKYSHII